MTNTVPQRVEGSIEVTVVERKNEAGVWSVEAIADDADGSIFQAHFYGPDAELRAREYAAFKYSDADEGMFWSGDFFGKYGRSKP